MTELENRNFIGIGDSLYLLRWWHMKMHLENGRFPFNLDFTKWGDRPFLRID